MIACAQSGPLAGVSEGGDVRGGPAPYHRPVMTRLRPGGTASGTQAGRSSSPIPRRLTVAGTALAGVGLVVLALCPWPGPPPRPPRRLWSAPTWPWVIPSTAGPGLPPQLAPGTRPTAPSACLRSSDNYPSLTARALGLHLRDASCSGATTRDLTAPQGPGIPAQLSSLGSSTSLVSLGIGGNDLGFSTIAENCVAVTPWGATRVGWSCRSHYTAGGVDQLALAVQQVGAKVATALQEIRSRAPHARVFVIGYPDLLPRAGRDAGRPSRFRRTTSSTCGPSRPNSTPPWPARPLRPTTPMSTWPPRVHLIAPAPLRAALGRSDPGLVRRLPPAPQCRGYGRYGGGSGTGRSGRSDPTRGI